MKKRSRGLRSWVACFVVAGVLVGCSDPYKQTVAAPGSDDYAGFARAMEKLPAEEKRLVNEYVARRERDGVRPVGVTLREAIDEEAKYEREEAELVAKLSHGARRVFDVAGRALASALPSPPDAPPAGREPADRAASPLPPPAQTAPMAPPPPMAPPGPPAPPMRPAAPPGPPAPPMRPAAPPGPPAPPTLPAAPPGPPAPTAPPGPQGGPPGPAAPPAGGAMTAEQFSQFIESVESTPFPDGRVARIKALPFGQRVTTAQSIALAQTVAFPSMQVEALAALYPRVVDPQNFESAYGTLTFPDDRERLRNRVRALH